jgi:hypothetical protein
MSAKFIEPSHFANPDTGARKQVEIANAAGAVHDNLRRMRRRRFIVIP